MISVIIPTYKEPEYLDICLDSLFKTQKYNNQVIVVCDGYYELNKTVLEKYKDKILLLDLSTNKGIAISTNIGVQYSSFEKILVVNDDNVFCKDWDDILLQQYNIIKKELNNDFILVPNQIEPYQSIFKSFKSFNFGTNNSNFKLNNFLSQEINFREDKVSEDGWTLPFMMTKKDYMIVGGWDSSYDSPHIVDWDFFLKLQLNNKVSYRTFLCNFYHFGGKATKNTDEKLEVNRQEFSEKEQKAYKQFLLKWGYYPTPNALNIRKPLEKGIIKGIQF